MHLFLLCSYVSIECVFRGYLSLPKLLYKRFFFSIFPPKKQSVSSVHCLYQHFTFQMRESTVEGWGRFIAGIQLWPEHTYIHAGIDGVIFLSNDDKKKYSNNNSDIKKLIFGSLSQSKVIIAYEQKIIFFKCNRDRFFIAIYYCQFRKLIMSSMLMLTEPKKNNNK